MACSERLQYNTLLVIFDSFPVHNVRLAISPTIVARTWSGGESYFPANQFMILFRSSSDSKPAG
jgi:hypothetical protein